MRCVVYRERPTDDCPIVVKHTLSICKNAAFLLNSRGFQMMVPHLRVDQESVCFLHHPAEADREWSSEDCLSVLLSLVGQVTVLII